ncbi:MAG TPA: DUF4136 domain-containing protein [Candidatus Acidoferrales bacterium]|nr:DUF4136 domain-containing protein [Candidatus Acidoferrales bacterium]
MLIATVVALGFLPGCSQPQPVHVERDPAADFKSYRTYSWQEPTLETRADVRVNSEDLAWRIRTAVDQELSLRGLHASDSGQPDLWVRYDLSIHERTTDSLQDYYRYWTTGGNQGPQDSYTLGYEELHLVLQLFDGHTQRSIWRGSAAIIADKQQHERLHEALQRMFEKPL